MEKIFVKPISKELIHKAGAAEGHTDIFSYNSDDRDDPNRLGSLFVVGHVKHETDDVAYMINLVAALAKREYYARPGTGPKEAFTAALKKINEVVQDFFKNNGLTANIGIFAIADDQIFISRLGKFKIVLARGGKNIDILNNIDLFEKEHIQEKEFSNIISGKILEKDRILAFYPAQPVVSREKYIKSYFLKLSDVDFIHKINQIKAANPAFSCALLYIDMHKVRQAALKPRPQPPELEVSLADAPAARPPRKRAQAPDPQSDALPAAILTSSPSSPDRKPEPTKPVPPLPDPDDQEMPRIIPTEFSVGKRDSILETALRRLTIPGLNLRNRAVLFAATAVSIIVLALVFKAFFVIDPEAKKLNAVLDSARSDMKLARAKLDENNGGEARGLLLASLETLRNLPPGNDKTEEVVGQLFSLLDSIDQTQEASPVLVHQLGDEMGKGLLLAPASASALYAYTEAEGTGLLLTVSGNSVVQTQPVKDAKPTILFGGSASPVLVDPQNGRISYIEKDELTTSELALPDGAVSADLYQDNLYVLTGQSIHKVADAAKGGTKTSQWLKEESVAPESFRIAVDGNVFTLSRNGTVTTYYRGQRKGETRTGLLPGEDSLFLTTQDSPHLFLIEKSLNRVYLIDKESGVVVKAYRIGSQLPIVTATVDTTDTVFFLTSDNKIWKLQ